MLCKKCKINPIHHKKVNLCKDCYQEKRKLQARKYRETNKEKIAAKKSKEYEEIKADPEKLKEKIANSRSYYLKNKKRCADYQKEYRKRNLEKTREYQKNYHKVWRKNNRTHNLAQVARTALKNTILAMKNNDFTNIKYASNPLKIHIINLLSKNDMSNSEFHHVIPLSKFTPLIDQGLTTKKIIETMNSPLNIVLMKKTDHKTSYDIITDDSIRIARLIENLYEVSGLYDHLVKIKDEQDEYGGSISHKHRRAIS